MLTVLLATQPGFVFYWSLRGDWTAVGMTVISILLTLASAWMDAPEDSQRAVWARRSFILMLIPLAVTAAATWSGVSSFFAAAGMALGCLARWQKNGNRLRALMLLTAVPWLAHDLMAAAVPSLCADIFGLARGLWIWAAERFTCAQDGRRLSGAEACARS